MFKIIFITSMFDNIYTINKVSHTISNEYKNQFEFSYYKATEIDFSYQKYEELIKDTKNSNLICIILHGGVSTFRNFLKLKEEINGKIPFFIYSSIEDENREFISKSGLSPLIQDKISKYYSLGGEKNYRNMLLYMANSLNHSNYKVEDYEYPQWEGIYDYEKKSYLSKEEENVYLDKLLEEKNIIALIAHGKEWEIKKIKVINKFIEEIKKEGGRPLVVFTNSVPNPEIKAKGTRWVIDNYFKRNGKIIPDCIINLVAYSQSIFDEPGDGTTMVDKSIFEDLGIPVIQAMNTYQNRKTWDNDVRGLDAMSLTSNVYYPEFDGQIISVTCCTYETMIDEFGEKSIFLPIDERVNKIARMAMGWSRLANKENKDKKIAIILHNMPPRNDMIGCAFGLDTPNSVYNMVETFSEMGVPIDYKFKNGDDIIQRIIRTVSNDQKWLTADKVLERSIDTIDREKYSRWFSKLNSKIKNKMEEQWGTAPGEFMVYEDLLPVPGILNGNIFIGLQPARGMME